MRGRDPDLVLAALALYSVAAYQAVALWLAASYRAPGLLGWAATVLAAAASAVYASLLALPALALTYLLLRCYTYECLSERLGGEGRCREVETR